MKLLQFWISLCVVAFASNALAEKQKPAGLGSLAAAVAAAAAKRLAAKDPLSIDYPEVLLAEPFGITRLNVNKSVRRMVMRTEYIGGIDYYIAKNRLYWSDLATGRVYTRALNARGRALYQLDLIIDRSPLQWRPKALAVDYVADKLYVVDARGKKVHVFELDGKNTTVTFDGILNEPMDIALDPHEGLMFVADGSRIVKLNMDGTAPVAIVDYRKYYIKSVTLDLENKRVYWADETYHRIKSANYDGSDLRILLKNEFGKPYSLLGPADLAFHDGHLYFYDDIYRRIGSIRIDNITGKADYTFRVVYDRLSVRAMRIIDPSRQKSIANPCAVNNGDCQKMCLISARNRTTGSIGKSCV